MGFRIYELGFGIYDLGFDLWDGEWGFIMYNLGCRGIIGGNLECLSLELKFLGWVLEIWANKINDFWVD